MNSIATSNEEQIAMAMRALRAIGNSRIGLLGLTFKPDTDDVRSSPLVEMARQLIAEGFEVRAYDPNVDLESLLGANLAFLEESLPSVRGIVVSRPDEILEFSETLVLGKNERVLVETAQQLGSSQCLLDLVGINEKPIQGEYVGIGW